MRKVLWAIAILSIAGSGCTENNNISAKDKVEIHVDKDHKIAVMVEIDPTLTPVHLWLADDGHFVFDNESWQVGKGDEKRMTIQGAIEERYPKYVIVRLFEHRDGKQFTYYAYIKPKPGVND